MQANRGITRAVEVFVNAVVEYVRNFFRSSEKEGAEPVERHWLWELVRTWSPAIIAVIVIRTFIFEPFRIPSGSMVPTLLIGDHVVVTKFSYGIWLRTPTNIPLTDVLLPHYRFELLDIGDPARGDIIVFMYPLDEPTNYIKRVIGIPGDRIQVRNNRVILNGVEQTTDRLGVSEFVNENCAPERKDHFEEDLAGVKHSIFTNVGNAGPLADHKEIVVPEDTVFVMGDNRDNSEDSRRWNFVRFDQIKGKAHRIWLSLDGCSGDVGGVRKDRFLQDLYAPVPEAAAPVPRKSEPL